MIPVPITRLLRPWALPCLCTLIAVAMPASPVSAASLGETVTAALTLGGQQQRVAALRDERSAVRDQAGSLIAEDPALRLKVLSDRMTENDGAYELEAMVDMPLWMPGQRSARVAVAESLGLRADALQRLLRWEAAGEVREAAWGAALAHGQLRQAAAALQAARSLEATVAKRAAAGELARMELLMARQETAARNVDLSAAQLGYDQAIAAFVLLTGQSRLPEPLLEAVPEARAAGTTGMALPPNHPLLASADGALAQARAERDRAGAERRGHPLLSLGGKRARDDRSVDPLDAVQLEISLPFGLKRQAAPMLAGAEREYTDRMTELHQVRRGAERDLKAAALAHRGAGDALVLARERARLAGDALGITRRAFDLGEADLAALLRAEERARDARLALELRSLERGRAVARLNQALGVVPE